MDIIEMMNTLYVFAATLINKVEAGLYHDIRDFKPGRIVIKSLRQVEHLWGEILAARGKQYYISKLTILSAKMGDYRLSVTSRSGNRLMNFIRIGIGEAKRSLHGRMQKFERYSADILQIKIEDPLFVDYLKTFKVVKADNKFYLDRAGDGKEIISVEEPDEVHTAKEWGFVDDEDEWDENLIIYGHHEGKSSESCATAGEIKKKILTLVAVKAPGLADAEVIEYALTYGGSRALCDEEPGQSTRKDCAQTSTRRSQKDAPNTPMGYVNNFAVYMGKVVDVHGNEYRDGWGFIAASFMAKLLTMFTEGKYHVLTTAVKGLLVQCRPYLCKLMAETVADDYINRFIARLHFKSAAGLVVLFRDEITDEDQRNYNLAVKSKGRKGKFAGHVVVLCDNRETWKNYGIQFITDLNGLKGPFDLRLRSTLNILSISHGTTDIKTGASFSSQLCQSLMVADWKRTIMLVINLFTGICLNVKNSILSTDAVAPRINDLEKPRWNMLLAKVAPAFSLKYYFPIYKQIVKESCKGLVNMAKNLKAPTEGFYAKIISDPGMDFGVNILKILPDGRMEVVAPIASRFGYIWGIAVKFPKQHFQEFGALKFISPDEYAERAWKLFAEGILSLDDTQLLVDKIKHTSDGAIIMPAYEKVKNMLAGMDFDGDACLVYLQREIVTIMSMLKPLAIVIDPDDDKTKGFTVDKNVGFTAMANAIENDNLDVGAVTVLHSIFSILLVRAKFKTGPVDKILNLIFDIKKGKEAEEVA